ncbi:carbonic anhydrase-like isoform X2 [Gigantopelta aegis]|uniref:carbonic anhydrase-like isoform X2 n=1 Tax=Gigantopelta aegis TaxID=1735272 RepID=UPI001B88A7E1|nr:carbonic anhydrase-like isoform X2 [Gigantopelta aegis]
MLTTTLLLGVTLWSWLVQSVHGGAGNKWTYVDNTLVQVALGGKPIYITGGGLGGRFRVEQFHFHWGNKNERGSEHAIDGLFYPMEMHIVLYNDMHPNFTSAVHETKGLAVLAFFFKVGQVNKGMFKILRHFSSIKFSGANKPIVAFPIAALLPKKINSWFRYDGSLTTPPCSESVRWTLFKDEISISHSQMKAFRKLLRNIQGQQNMILVDNYRPLQELNKRKVYTNLKFQSVGNKNSNQLE